MWEKIERFLKIAGIIGVVAAVVGVWIQLRDFNDRARAKEIRDWQSSIVYQIIEDGKKLDLQQISERYVNEAAKSYISLPREKLTDTQLRLVLIDLMNENVIVVNSGKYRINNADQPESFIGSAQFQNIMSRNVGIARQVLADQGSVPLLQDRLLAKVRSAGGDTGFLNENAGIFIQALVDDDIAIFLPDGRIAAKSYRPNSQP